MIISKCTVCDRPIDREFLLENVCPRCVYRLVTRSSMKTKEFVRSAIADYDGELFMSRTRFNVWVQLGEILYGKEQQNY
jgi:hypothetical protein